MFIVSLSLSLPLSLSLSLSLSVSLSPSPSLSLSLSLPISLPLSLPSSLPPFLPLPLPLPLLALMWGYGLLLTMFVTVREELFGKYKAPDVTMFAVAYGGYIMVPLLIMLRVACTPVFPSSANSQRKPTKEIKTD